MNSIEAKRLQAELAEKVISNDDLEWGELRSVCGFDASYSNQTAYCSAVVMQRSGPDDGFEVIEEVDHRIDKVQPYVPGLFMLREGPPALQTIRKVKTNFQVLLVDGHGVLHPRRCGLASYLGIVLDKPTIGVAKNLLCGTLRNNGFIEHEGQILGFALGARRKIYVSVGHRISLRTAISVAAFVKRSEWLPEPLLLADQRSKLLRRSDNSKNSGRVRSIAG